MHAEKHKSRLDRRITFDFAGRKVVEEEGAPHYDFEQVCNQLEDAPTRLNIDFFMCRTPSCWSCSRMTPSQLPPRSRKEPRKELLPILTPPGEDQSTQNWDVGGRQAKLTSLSNQIISRDSEGSRQVQGPGRVQDGGLLEMSDMGNCMSMHQVTAQSASVSFL